MNRNKNKTMFINELESCNCTLSMLFVMYWDVDQTFSKNEIQSFH